MIDQEEKNVASFINISNAIVIVSEIYLRKNNQTINIVRSQIYFQRFDSIFFARIRNIELEIVRPDRCVREERWASIHGSPRNDIRYGC